MLEDASPISSAGSSRLSRWAASPRAWLLVAVLAAALRLGFALAIPFIEGANREEGGELVVALGSDGYEKIARNLLDGNGYRTRPDVAPTMLRNPGYVWLLAGAFSVFGRDKIVGQVIQALFAGAIVLLMRRLGQRIVSPQASFLGALAYAFYVPDWLACAKYVAEPMLGVLLMLSLVVAASAGPAWALGRAVGLGVLGGAMILTKSVAIGFLPCLLGCWILFGGESRGRLGRAVVFGLVAAAVQVVVLLPWGFYNQARSGRFVLTSTIAGWAFFDSQYVAGQRHRDVARQKLWKEARAEARRLAEAEGIRPHPRDEWAFTFTDIKDEAAMGDLLKRHALAGIRADPLSYSVVVLRGLAEFWYAGRSKTSTLVGAVVNLPLLVLAVVGLAATAAWRNPTARLAVAAVAYMNLITALSFAVARYAIPVMPVVLLFAAAGMLAITRRWRGDATLVAAPVV